MDTATSELHLDVLPSDVLCVVAVQARSAQTLGRLCCTSRHYATVLLTGEFEDAWRAVWDAITRGSCLPPGVLAHASLRDVTSLENLRWTSLASPELEEPQEPQNVSNAMMRSGHALPLNKAPRWREDACVLTCNEGRRLVLFGGRDANRQVYLNDTWACDLTTGEWQPVHSHGVAPTPRCFDTDAGGWRVLRSGEEEFAVLFGGKCEPGYRDNETWLLGPLDEPPERWAWLRTRPDREVGTRPAARFHHSLTVVPRREATALDDGDPTGDDFLFLIGGHDRTISPIGEDFLHCFSLRDAGYHWLSEDPNWSGDESDDRRVGATVTWVAQPRDPQPTPRGFHAAAHWSSPWKWGDFVVVSCGLGIRDALVDDGELEAGDIYQALGDTWLYDVCLSTWMELASLPSGRERSRAALAVAGDRLILAGGCTSSSGHSLLAVGSPFDDLWMLDLLSAVRLDSSAAGGAGGAVPRQGAAWERVILPAERVARPPHLNSHACTLHGGAVLLILGGHGMNGDRGEDRDGSADQFGDLGGRHAHALHEGIALALGISAPARPEARLCVDGLPHSHQHDANDGRCRPWWRQPGSTTYGKRMLLHGLVGSAHLNGAVGTAITQGDFGGHDSESRLAIRLLPPHGCKPDGSTDSKADAVQVRRRNLSPGRMMGNEQPLIAQPSPDDDGTCLWALVSARGQAAASSKLELLQNGIALRRLSVLPMPEPVAVERAVAAMSVE